MELERFAEKVKWVQDEQQGWDFRCALCMKLRSRDIKPPALTYGMLAKFAHPQIDLTFKCSHNARFKILFAGVHFPWFTVAEHALATLAVA